MKKYFTVELNGEIYADPDGNNYRFATYQKAQDFIEENGLTDAEITPQY